MDTYQQIGLGTYKLREEACVEIVKEALNIGYRHIDSAQLYKNHEQVCQGIALSGVPREDIFLTSKIQNKNIISKCIAESIDSIKKELEIDYLDLLLLHNPVENYVDGWKNLIYAKNHFNILNIGVSNFEVEHIKTIKDQFDILPDLNQIEYNIFQQRPHLIDYCNENNVIVQSHTGLTRKKKFEDVKLVDFSEKHDVQPGFFMHKFILQKNIGILPKTTNLDHLQENFNLASQPNLSDEMMEELNGFDEQFTLYK